MTLTKLTQSMVQDSVWVFDTLTELEAEPNIPVGARATTYGYNTAGDGGGNRYKIVASGTGVDDGGSSVDLAASGHEATGLFPEGIYTEQFGAKGDGTTDDAAAIQACLDYCKTIPLVWDSDDRASNQDFGATVTVKGRDGHVYAMESGVSVTVANRNLRIENMCFLATGSSWATSDFIVSGDGGNATFLKLMNLKFNCAHKCSGLEQRSNSESFYCEVKHAAGDSIKLNGTRCVAYFPRLKQYDVNDDAFYTPSNYTAYGIHMASDDCWLVGGFVGWHKYNVYVAPDVVNCHIINTHMFQGMEFFADNIDIATGLTAIGRNDPNIYIAAKANVSTRPNVFIYNCYIDNGFIEAFHSSFTIRNCSYHSNAKHSPSGVSPWHVIHAEQPNDIWRGIIQDGEVGVVTRVRNWVDFQEQSSGYNSHTFNPTTAVNTTTDIITIASHNLTNDDRVLYDDGGGTVIGGLADNTNYYVINTATNTFQLSTTIGGAAIDLTSVGVGTTHNFTDQHTWIFDDTVIEGADWNTANASNSPFYMSDTAIKVSLSESVWIFHGQGDKAYFEVSDKDSTAASRIGVDADQAIIETPNGSMRVDTIDGATTVKFDTNGWYPPALSADPTSPTPVAGQTYYNTTTDKLRTYNGTIWNNLY